MHQSKTLSVSTPHWKRVLALCLMATLATTPSWAWESKTQTSVVVASGHVLASSSTLPKKQFIEYLTMGTRISPEVEEQLYPNFDTNPGIALQREIYLLQAIKGDRVDPYFTFRMGALGKKIVEIARPMRNAPIELRDAYYQDVEKNIGKARITSKPVENINISEYFNQVMSEAARNDRTIRFDYGSDIGFSGIASNVLHEDASRAVNAVTNVWNTIINNKINNRNQSKTDMREYMLGAIDFYLKHKKINEVDAVYKQAESKRILTPELRKLVGDLYFNNEFYEEALRIYHALLSDNPSQRDVASQIAKYHILMGDREAKKGNLEDARDAYQLAAQVDSFADEATDKLTEMNMTIDKRDNRNMSQEDLNQKAIDSIANAEASAVGRDYAAAIQYLQEARDAYMGITSEFPELYKSKAIGMNQVKMKLDQMKDGLIKNAQRLSGSGAGYDARRLADMTEDAGPTTMQSMLKTEYDLAVKDIAQDIN